MNQELVFALISIAIMLWGASTYFIDIIGGRSIPHPYSYLLWLFLVGFNTYVLFSLGEWYSFAQGCFNTGICLIFSIIGFYHIGKVQIHWFDHFCLILACLMILYWYVTRDIMNTVIMTIIIDLISSLPTLKKIWIQPWSETIKLYISSVAIAGFTIITLSNIDLNFIFWIYLIFINILIIGFGIGRRYYLRGWNSIFE